MIEASFLYGNESMEKINKAIDIINTDYSNKVEDKLIIFNESNWYVIVEEDEKIVGLGSLTKSDDKFLIDSVYVLKDKRKNYYGDLIVKMLLNKGFQFNAERIYTKNIESIKIFYTKIGFKEINKSELVITEEDIHKCNH